MRSKIYTFCLAGYFITNSVWACIPQPRHYELTTQPIYLEINNTKFSIPEKYVSQTLSGKVDFFEIWYRTQDVGTNKDFKIHMKNREEIKVGNKKGFQGWAESGLIPYRDELLMPHPFFNSDDELKQFVDQFIVTKLPADWDETMQLAAALEPEKLLPLAPCAAFSPDFKPIDPKTIGAPKIEVIEMALKNKNPRIRAVGVQWLGINSWGLNDIEVRLDAIEQKDPSDYVREEAKFTKARISRPTH